MQTIAIDDLGVWKSVVWVDCTKMAEQIDILFWVETPREPRNILLDVCSHPLQALVVTKLAAELKAVS